MILATDTNSAEECESVLPSELQGKHDFNEFKLSLQIIRF